MKRIVTITITAAAALTCTQGWPAGFERPTTNSAHYSVLGEAVQGMVSGSEALYFNPAGLVGTHGKENRNWEFTVNVNPSWSNTNSPYGASGAQLDGQQQLTPPYSAFASYALSDRLGIGLGTYIAGGGKVIYDPTTFSTGSIPTVSQFNFTIYEYALGAGYQLTDNLRVGASYRIDQTWLSRFDSTVPGTGLVSYQDNNQLTANTFDLGAQYQMTGWGIGANYRHRLAPTLSGNSVLQTLAGTQIATSASTITGAALPAQINVAGYYDVSAPLRILLGYSWTNYASVSSVQLSSPSLPAAALQNQTFTTAWNDQHQIRAGAQYLLNDAWALRAGYILSTQVTPSARASGTLYPPAFGNTFQLGAGWGVTRNLQANLGLEYSSSSGTASSSDTTSAVASGTSPIPIAGTYSGYLTTLRLGVTYSL